MISKRAGAAIRAAHNLTEELNTVSDSRRDKVASANDDVNVQVGP